jgi:hypothetical protein
MDERGRRRGSVTSSYKASGDFNGHTLFQARLLIDNLLIIRGFIKNNYRLTCFLGLENSPTCGIHWGKHKVNHYQTESPNPVDHPSGDEPLLMGIMAVILAEELAKENIKVPFLEFPVLSPQDSEKRKTFGEDLRKTVELGVAEGNHDD